MSFNLSVPKTSGDALEINVAAGQVLFVLGANGTGKSSLMHRFASAHRGNSKRISASRQTWFQSSALEFSPSQKAQIEQQTQNWDANQQSRWMEQNAQYRSGLTRYELIDAENGDARAIALAVRSGNIQRAEMLACQPAPLAKINELFQLSNIPISISVSDGDRLVASKIGSQDYDAAELSDGERNALLVAADVLTAKPGCLLIIDEPERHLHRSIISPLLSALFAVRSDCMFVVATHDLLLPIDNPDARVLLVRGCNFSGKAPVAWDVDLVPANADLDDALKYDLIGARRKIIFVEGEESSLDQPLYAILFPGVSVRTKGPSREVEQATAGLRSAEAVHWIRAWGIVDHDGRSTDEVEALKSRGIFALKLHSVEAIYYHPETITRMSHRYANVSGGIPGNLSETALSSAISEIRPHVTRLAARAVEREVRREIFSKLPTMKDIESGLEVVVNVNTTIILSAEVSRLNAALDAGDWVAILQRCPIRESGARGAVARSIGFPTYRLYESAVLKMLRDDSAAREAILNLFEDLTAELAK